MINHKYEIIVKNHLKLTVSFFLLAVFNLYYAKAHKFIAHDTISFSTNKNLLAFKGKINGIEVDFAFDTGASVGVANSSNILKANIKVYKTKLKVQDANQQKQKISKVFLDSLSIGNQVFYNINDVGIDMSYLECNNFYLLGQNVIKSLNWKIDFEKNILIVSKKSFENTNNYSIWNINKNKNKRPFIDLTIDNKKYPFLIDLGFVGYVDVNENVKGINNAFNLKIKQGFGHSYMSSNMGLFGFSKAELNNQFTMDSLEIGGLSIHNIPINIKNNTDNKLGFGFFKEYCKTMILNFTEDKIYLEPSLKEFTNKLTFDLKLVFKDNKIMVLGKITDKNSSANNFEIGEEIKSIENRKASDFKTECDFLNWYYFIDSEKVEIIKMNDEKIQIFRSID